MRKNSPSRPAPSPTTLKGIHEFWPVGTGYTRRTEARVRRDIADDREYPPDLTNLDVVSSDDHPAFVWYASYFEWLSADPERFLSSIREWATGILERVGIPVRKIYGAVMRYEIIRVAERSGFRRGQDLEWYAAAFLKHARILHRNLFSGSTGSPDVAWAIAAAAIQLGAVMKEAEIRIGFVGRNAQKAGRARGEKITAERASEHAALQEAAAKMKRNRSKRAKAEQLKAQFPKLSAETIRKRI